MNKNSGASLFEYIVILSIIAVSLVPIYFLFGKNIVNHLTSLFYSAETINNNMNQNIMDNESRLIVSGNVAPGNLNGTADNPVKKCVDNTCSIDFGTYVLNGIPDNFNEIIETSGASGGTEELIGLLKQLAEQLDDPATPLDEGKDYRDMANLGHLIARMQESFETAATNCSTDSDPNTCYRNNTNWASNLPSFPIDSGLSTVIPNFTSSENYTYWDAENFTSIAQAKQMQVQYLTSFNNDKNRNPAFALVDKFDKIMNDGSVPDNLKYITEQIYRNLASISEQQLINRENVVFHTPNFNNRIDPVTGDNLDSISFDGSGNLNDILHLQSSAGSDIDSAIVCATGVNKDTGQNCHNNN